MPCVSALFACNVHSCVSHVVPHACVFICVSTGGRLCCCMCAHANSGGMLCCVRVCAHVYVNSTGGGELLDSMVLASLQF